MTSFSKSFYGNDSI